MSRTVIHTRMGQITVSTALTVLLSAGIACSQNTESDSIYLLAADTTGSPSTTSAASPPAAEATASAPFDLARQPEEHPLVPLVRALQASQAVIDESIRDYSCTLVKRERVDGQLGEYQHIFMKVMHDPFSVYMSFLQPYTGREVVYVDGQNENKLIVLEAGIKRWAGKISLDPHGSLAMKGQKHPITRVGIRNLTVELLKICEAEMRYAECDVMHNTETKIHGRPTTMIQVVHPIPRQNFRFHVARVFFDNELRVPIHFDAFGWPTQESAQPPLEESYTYQNLKINNGFTARDFDAYNNPDIFKP